MDEVVENIVTQLNLLNAKQNKKLENQEMCRNLDFLLAFSNAVNLADDIHKRSWTIVSHEMDDKVENKIQYRLSISGFGDEFSEQFN